MAEYITVAVEVDVSALEQQQIAKLQETYPGMVLEDAHPLFILARVNAEMHAENRQVLTEMFDSIFREYGAKVLRIIPFEATQATGFSTWTVTDTLGYTIEAGTQLTLLASDGTRVAFEVRNEVVIPPGSASTAVGEVEIIAVPDAAGAQGTGLQSSPLLEVPQSRVGSIVVTAPTIGGENAEEDATYLNRLADAATLQGNTLVIPRDYEADARVNQPEVDRALALDLYQAPINEIQQINVANATGGTATYTFEGQTTAAVAHNANAATVQAALEALSNVAPGDVTVTGGPLNTSPLLIEFKGTLGGANRTQMTSTSSLTGGSASIAHSTLQGGQAGVASTAGTLSLAVVDADGLDPGSTVRDELQARQQELSAGNLVVSVIPATYNVITVVFAAVAYAEFDPADVESRAEEAVAELFLSPARHGLPPFGDQKRWIDTPLLEYDELIRIIKSVEGLHTLTSATLNGGTSDVTMTGPAAMPSTASTVSGTVTVP